MTQIRIIIDTHAAENPLVLDKTVGYRVVVVLNRIVSHQLVRLKMNNSPLILMLAIFLWTTPSNAAEALPSDSEALIEKLESFEQETLGKAQKEIADKRLAVAEVLRAHMERETRGGNLEGALALKNKIEALAPKENQENEAASSRPVVPEKDEMRSVAVGPVWAIPGSAASISFQFMDDGSGIKMFQGRPQKIKWEIDGEIITSTLGAAVKESFLIDVRRKKLWTIDPNGKKGRELELKR
ncbi:MAG: hypothetical protein R3F13_09170 [Prosthecobacter sp.]